MKNSSIFLLIIFIILLTNCTHKIKKSYIDITPPSLSCHMILEDRVLFQFDEPVSNFELFLNNNEKTIDIIKIVPHIPKNNFFVDSNFFSKNYSNIIIKVSDTENNENIIEVSKVVINMEETKLSIAMLQLKHSKTNNQKLKIVNRKTGTLDGMKIVILFANAKRIELPFIDEKIEELNELNFEVIYNKNSNNKNEILFSKKDTKIELNSRLSENYGAILIKNYKNEVVDYIIYYNSKKNSLETLHTKKNFIKIMNELKNEPNIDLNKIVDINGISSKRPITRVGNDFVIGIF